MLGHDESAGGSRHRASRWEIHLPGGVMAVQGTSPLAFLVMREQTWEEAISNRGPRGQAQTPICFPQRGSNAQFLSQVHS